MLDYLFEVKHLHRVTIDPDVRNARAVRAYEKSGFRLDGILRHNEQRDDGTYADTQYLSLLEDEWPAVKAAWLGA
jgi:RimJ/RimL family protein N-acetyltransferase